MYEKMQPVIEIPFEYGKKKKERISFIKYRWRAKKIHVDINGRTI
ncbi:MAG: hypothetical protein Q4B89_06580 [Lachnospiraceae bacterium]|nr:hypothetical protein [Lachnospiraceae bacterium]